MENREQIIKNSLQETKEEISQIEITIQKLNDLKVNNTISVINQELNKPIKELTTQKEFLEDIYDNDKQSLFSMITDDIKHKAINSGFCAICGNKLYSSCYAEDSFSIECVNCEMLYAEH